MHVIDHHLTAPHRHPRQFMARLKSNTSGLALLEFAFAMPIVLSLGLYGVETANFALINMKVSQIALNLADNASRVGVSGTLSTQQLREYDMNDVLQAARFQGQGIKLTQNGRITVSSLEYVPQSYDNTPVQRIHWQRCIGLKSGSAYDSNYGKTKATDGTGETVDTAGTIATDGMGKVGAKVNAPLGSAVMFVEVNYDYQPLVGQWLLPNTRISYIASYIVRDTRIYTRIFNPEPSATPSTCDRYTA